MDQAVEYVSALMTEASGRPAVPEEVPIASWTRGPVAMDVAACSGGSAEIVQYRYTPAADITGPLLEAGCGSSQEIETLEDNPAGSILLVRDCSPPGKSMVCGEQIISALGAGVKGLIVVSTLPDGLARGAYGRSMGGRTLPTVGVSRALGGELRRIASEKGLVRLITAGQSHRTVCHNVVAEIGQGNEVLVVSAHLDTHDLAPGAFDNTSGICAMTEIMFAMAQCEDSFKRRIRFIAFTGEEVGFAGSRSYVQQHSRELDEIVFQLNLDSVFADTACGMAVHLARPAVAYFRKLFVQAKRSVRVIDYLSSGSDYVPFTLQGIPTARQANLNVGDPPWPHTIVDTADKIDCDAVKMNAMVYAQLLLRLALADEPFPAPRLGRDEILGELGRWGVLDQWQQNEYLQMLRGQTE